MTGKKIPSPPKEIDWNARLRRESKWPALPDNKVRADLNGDGIIDVLPTISRGNTYENILPPDKYFSDLGGIKTAKGGLIRFKVAPPEINSADSHKRNVVVCTDPKAKFHVPNSKQVFSPGDQVSATVDGKNTTFVLTGVALRFGEGTTDFIKQFDITPHLPHYSGYGVVNGRIVEVPLDQLQHVK